MAVDIVLDSDQVVIEPKLEIRCSSGTKALKVGGNAEVGMLEAQTLRVDGHAVVTSLSVKEKLSLRLPTGPNRTARRDEIYRTIDWIVNRLNLIESRLGMQTPVLPEAEAGRKG